jgi:hypothetical protein
MKPLEVVNLHILAYHQFGLTLPVPRAVLKTRYRERARALHTDTSGADTKEAFIKMQQAYELLTADDARGVFTDGPQMEKTEEGTPLKDLGLGLGSLKNGRTCEECSGKGYHERAGKKWIPRSPCYLCLHFYGQYHRLCPKCKKEGLRIVTEKYFAICGPCKGSGEIEIFNPVIPKGLLPSGNLTQKQRKRAQ